MTQAITVLFSILLLLSSNTHAQNTDTTKTNISSKIDLYNFDKDCYIENGQQDVNYCLSLVVTKLSNTLQSKYNYILKYFDGEIEKYSSDPLDASITNNLIKQKQLLISSQKAWQSMADENAKFWGIGGGTISNQYIAESYIKDTKERLTFLDSFMEEMNQGFEK